MLIARNNPFATDRLEQKLQFRPEWSGLSWEMIDRRIARHGHRCAITGDHGTGKTTLLHALATRFNAQGSDVVSIFFNDGQPPQLSRILALRDQIGSRSMILCDGGELLGVVNWLALRWVARKAEALIITGHATTPLPVAIRLQSSPALLRELFSEVDPDRPWHTQAESLLAAHDGNIRCVFRACYLSLAETETSP